VDYRYRRGGDSKDPGSRSPTRPKSGPPADFLRMVGPLVPPPFGRKAPSTDTFKA